MKIFLIVVFVALVIMESGEMSYLLPSLFAGGEFNWVTGEDGMTYLLISFKDGNTLCLFNLSPKHDGLMAKYFYTGLEYETAGRITRFANRWPVNWIARKLAERR